MDKFSVGHSIDLSLYWW